MPPRWSFSRHRPGERARNSKIEEFFRSDEVADPTTALVREGIQNSLDAATSDSVNVRISIGKVIRAGACSAEQFSKELPSATHSWG